MIFDKLIDFYDNNKELSSLPIGFRFDEKKDNIIIDIDSDGKLIGIVKSISKVPVTYRFVSRTGPSITPFCVTEDPSYLFYDMPESIGKSNANKVNGTIDTLAKINNPLCDSVIKFLNNKEENIKAFDLISQNHSDAMNPFIIFSVNSKIISEDESFQKDWNEYIVKNDCVKEICLNHLSLKNFYGSDKTIGVKFSINDSPTTSNTYNRYNMKKNTISANMTYEEVHKIYGALNYLTKNGYTKNKEKKYYFNIGNCHIIVFSEKEEVQDEMSKILDISLDKFCKTEEIIERISKIQNLPKNIIDFPVNVFMFKGTTPEGFTRLSLVKENTITLQEISNNIKKYIDNSIIDGFYPNHYQLSEMITREQGKNKSNYFWNYSELLAKMIVFGEENPVRLQKVFDSVKTKEQISKTFMSFIKYNYNMKGNNMEKSNVSSKLGQVLAIADHCHWVNGSQKNNIASKYLIQISKSPRKVYIEFIENLYRILKWKNNSWAIKEISLIMEGCNDIPSIFSENEKISFWNSYFSKKAELSSKNEKNAEEQETD